MSSDDSSASSEDSILNSPIIKKKDGRTKRAEKAKMDFLDECLNGTNARAAVHRRIANVERDQIRANSLENEGSGAEEEAKVGNGVAGIHLKSESSINDETNGDASKTTTISSEKENQPQATKENAKPESEESYWARIDNFARKNSTARTNSNGSFKNSLSETRKRLCDVRAGLDYDSETDDEDGEWKDGKEMTREERREEAAAKLIGKQSALGLRRVFFKKAATAGVERRLRFYAFQSRDEALEGLTSIINRLNEQYKNSQSTSEHVLQQHFIRPLSRLLKTSKQNLWGRGIQSIYRFLECNPIISSHTHIDISCGCNPTCVLLIPDLFIQWMWKISCSSLGLASIEMKCCRLLTNYLKENSVKNLSKSNDHCSVDAETDSFKKFYMGDLATCLIDDFGLWMGSDSPSEETKNQDLVETSGENNESSEVDINSLKKLFMLWSSLMDEDCVQLDEANPESGVVGEGATRDLVALARVSLDPQLELAAQRYKICGDNMSVDIIQRPITSLIDSVARQIKHALDEEQFSKWLENTSIAIIESCSTFSAGESEAADCDDQHGHLPLATVISNFQGRMPMSDCVSYESALLNLCLAEKALEVCLLDIDDWEVKVKTLIDTRCESWGEDRDSTNSLLRSFSDRSFRAFVASEVAFQWMDGNMENLLRDLPLFLAAVHIAGECVMAGARLFFRSAAPSNFEDLSTESFVRYSIEERDVIYETLSSIQSFCESLRAECGRRSVISYPHLRRAKEHITRLCKFIDSIKGTSSKEKRQKRRSQGSLDCFLRSSQGDFSPLE